MVYNEFSIVIGVTNMKLTENEYNAYKTLYKSCLSNMGGDCYEHLESDPYVWCDIEDLTRVGWSKQAASGTLSSLKHKGLWDNDGFGDSVGSIIINEKLMKQIDKE